MRRMRLVAIALVLALASFALPACKRSVSRKLDDALARIESADKTTRAAGYAQLAELLNKNAITEASARPYAARAVAAYDRRHTRLVPMQRTEPPTCDSWVTKGDYPEIRDEAELLLDLLSYVHCAASEAALRRALVLHDRHLKYFAVRSLARLRLPIDPAIVADAAAGNLDRAHLYDALAENGVASMFPQSERTQEAFARSEMVHWLVFPTELGCEPEKIEMMKVVPEGADDFYVFRFTQNDADGGAPRWKAGVAGPYVRAAAPTTVVGSGTFSDLEPWESATPEEHARRIEGLLTKGNE